jgi:single-strand DNA-binding protein
MIIGNLTKDPELRTTATGLSVCSFTVAVNRRKPKQQGQNQQPEADYFRVSAWRERGEVCAKYLSKGKKVCVIGTVAARAYTTSKGEAAASLEVTADEVEFLSPRDEGQQKQSEPPKQVDQQTGYEQVQMEDDELPF